MPSRRRQLPRSPRHVGLVRAVRHSHRGYQTYGNTARDSVKAEARDRSVYAVHEELERTAADLFALLAPHPPANAYHQAKGTLRAAYPSDTQLIGDLRKVRYNPSGHPGLNDLLLTVVLATSDFRRRIDATKSLGKKAKRRARAQAWTHLHAVLSSVDVAFLAHQHSRVEPLRTVASGSLR
jgi:hypothetical protein